MKTRFLASANIAAAFVATLIATESFCADIKAQPAASFDQLLQATYAGNPSTHPGTATYVISKLISGKPAELNQWSQINAIDISAFQPTEAQKRAGLARLRDMAFSGTNEQMAAIQALGIAEDAESCDRLANMLSSITNPPSVLLWTIGEIKCTNAVPALLRLLNTPNYCLPEQWYEALSSIATEDALLVLLEALSRDLRDQNALRAIARCFPKAFSMRFPWEKGTQDDLRGGMSPHVMRSLSEECTRVVGGSKREAWLSSVSIDAISCVSQCGTWFFVTAGSSHGGHTFLTRRGDGDTWTNTAIVGGWIE